MDTEGGGRKKKDVMPLNWKSRIEGKKRTASSSFEVALLVAAPWCCKRAFLSG
jgi:hypothetical protein